MLTEQVYRFIKWNFAKDATFTISYSQLAFLYCVEMSAIYDVLNQLTVEGKLTVEAVKSLGNGDYEVNPKVHVRVG